MCVQAYGVWWFPGMVLNMGAFLLSLAWGLLIFTLSWLRWRSTDTGTQVPLRTRSALLYAAMLHNRLRTMFSQLDTQCTHCIL